MVKRVGFDENDNTQAFCEQLDKDWEAEKLQIIAERDKLKEQCANLQEAIKAKTAAQ